MTAPSVLVIQNGARHDYAIPNAFAEQGMLEAFYTDMCGTPFLDRLSHLPGMPSALKRLGGRRPAANVAAVTRMDPLTAFAMTRLQRQSHDPVTFAQARREIVQKQQARQVRWGLGKATHVFSAFGEGGALLQKAKAAGLTVLSDIYVALSSRQIEWDEWEKHPDWGPKPVPPDSTTQGMNPHTRTLLETTDVFVCPSAFVAKDLVANWNVHPEATRIVPYAAAQGWGNLAPSPQPGRVLFAGSATRRKGIHILAEAARDLRGRRPDIEIVVAGGVPDEVKNNPKASALTFLGRVPRSAIKNVFETADVFAFPTLAEGSATVVYEAMAAGLPVITTEAAGSVIQHDHDGLIIPERAPAQLAAAIETVVDDRALRQRLSQQGQETIKTYSHEAQAAALRNLVLAS